MSQKVNLPKQGLGKMGVLSKLDEALTKEPDVLRGNMSCYAMKGTEDMVDVVSQAYQKYFFLNGVARRFFPGLQDLEADVTGMASNILSGGADGIVANITSGGTESIFCALHAAREWAKETKPHIKEPEIVAPYSIHATFSKGCQYLGIKIVRVPVRDDWRADAVAIEAAISPNTIMIAGSAPSWPYGVIDNMDELAEVSKKHDLWLHVDACVGGYLSPFVSKLGIDLPKWDFSVDGVHSISADLHKYGYAAKGISTIAWRSEELQKYHFVSPTDWPCSPYITQAFTGSRPASAVAAAWAALSYLGEDGYIAYADRAMKAKARLIEGLNKIEGIEPIDTDLLIVVYGAKDIRVEQIVGGLSEKGWTSGGVMDPPLAHLVLDPLSEDVVDIYLEDLRAVVDSIRAGEASAEGTLSYAD
ncbi:aminotransferase class V-fold PLP-dependent enzyme [Hyphococcus flavus]|uniref:Aminotransferase class V-fold PLP-dependent enzyme n=1 Tax=Hyphococcus flavus TaxID=1866326 RepID=A0AAF0CB70_9PROT|nr:aminotransferase class V-fold PLP-dependent enzyme [Hyphococcus flavus]WDI30115.1 aminotransferase class V-fold PLP-dependent enzyme [Hyphococcus flavus]